MSISLKSRKIVLELPSMNPTAKISVDIFKQSCSINFTMEITSDTVTQEVQLAGNLKYIQFTTALINFIDREILSEGWQSSTEAFRKIIPKGFVTNFKNAIHKAILSGFDDSLNEMLGSVDLPKQWDILYQVKSDERRDTSLHDNSKTALLNMKLKHRNNLQFVIALKLQKIEHIKQRLHICKLSVSKKVSALQATKLKYRKNAQLLEELDSINF